MKKILIISPCNLPIPSVLGGAVETLIDNLIKENEESEINKFTILSIYNKDAYQKSQKYKNSEFIYIKKNKIITIFDNIINKIISIIQPSKKNYESNLIWKLNILIYIYIFLINNNYDNVVLENQGYYTKIYKFKKIRKKYKNKLYYHLHNVASNNLDSNFLKNEKTLVISNFLKKDILKRYQYASEKNILILKNGIDCLKFTKPINNIELTKIRNKYGFKQNDIIICFVGRIVPEKGVLEVLKAIKEIENKNIKLMIVGSIEFGKKKTSEFENEVKNICLELNERAIMTGFIPNDKLYVYYKMSQTAVLPSICEEAGGLTMIESLMCETPLITTNSGGITEYINENMAIILEKNNLVEDIKKSIIEINNNTKKYKDITTKAKKYISKEYNTETFYQNFIKYLN